MNRRSFELSTTDLSSPEDTYVEEYEMNDSESAISLHDPEQAPAAASSEDSVTPGSLLGKAPISDDEDPKGIRELSAISSFGVVINAIIGTGFFSVPQTYYQSGMALSIVMTVFCGLFSMLGAAWVLEGVSRARGYDHARKNNIQHNSQMNIFTFRQIELSEIAYIFAGNKGRIFAFVIFGMYALGSLWAYVSMFASTSANLLMLYAIGDPEDCIIESSPSLKCQFTYLMCVVFFAICVMLLETMAMDKLAIFQGFFTIYRFVAFSAILVACVISLVNNGAFWLKPSDPSISSNIFRVDPAGFPGLFSATSFALNCGYNLPNILTPMKRGKKNALKVAMTALLTAMVIYIGLSIILSLTLGEDTLQFVILNFARYGKKGFQRMSDTRVVETNWFSLIIKFVVMLFPMLNMISSFPLVCGSISFNFYSSLPAKAKLALGSLGPVLFRFCVTLLPFILAAFLPSLGIIIKFCGLSAVFLIIFIPAFFQFYGKRKCGSEWKTPYSGWWSHNIFVLIAMLYGAFALIYSIVQFIMDMIK
ncbi:putative amino acid transporter [Monocercomonoides exilis]|uniref:putative amino acid transporter n=1 Tax=Monocercomonoides exilis TaxID=2049356 RepID=UPI003559C57D|nr:putative amino acid transporter [Monocercomonoides exilis]|eukprot:MONOS_442.1-p1 / transcript=MONOS_442.1 / gene=MONOS_442 / organism=Monocercomonoides_exilis_PA203 / gene_product=amino acid transporter, putative / transcript_product=amino acid transporter, putative / location=Mono_scaffold00007:99159-100879(-) / protein_length=534 / sequence_SO=supercontig / SO=protein_coding / is_pseudo=false